MPWNGERYTHFMPVAMRDICGTSAVLNVDDFKNEERPIMSALVTLAKFICSTHWSIIITISIYVALVLVFHFLSADTKVFVAISFVLLMFWCGLFALLESKTGWQLLQERHDARGNLDATLFRFIGATAHGSRFFLEGNCPASYYRRLERNVMLFVCHNDEEMHSHITDEQKEELHQIWWHTIVLNGLLGSYGSKTFMERLEATGIWEAVDAYRNGVPVNDILI